MRLPNFLLVPLVYFAGLITRRPPDVKIGPQDDPYMNRWFVIPRNKRFNIYLHHFRHDDDRILHSHPWWSLSISLSGLLGEWSTPSAAFAHDEAHHKYRHVHAGDVVLRSPDMFHRVVVHVPATTIFVTGPMLRTWYFACKKGLMHWKDYVDNRVPGAPGAGCGET